MDRKLAVILAADVVGYSAMMERDEAATHDRVRASRKELFEPMIARHHGVIFKLMGDGLLAEFSSVVEAMECAVLLQRGLAERNASLEPDQRIHVRIGVNLGEVIVEGDDRFGEGVNIAARLEQLAEPGGIWVSGKVAKEVERKLAFGFQPMGRQKVKNITEPVEAFRVTIDGKGIPRRVRRDRSRLVFALAVAVLVLTAASSLGWWLLFGNRERLADRGIPTIAVLPFKNMSGDPSLDYFSDGMTDNLISMLAGVTELKVLSRNFTFAYKDKPTDVRQIGQELNAAYVLEGSIWKAPERVRVTAQLIDTRTGESLWAEKFDRTGADPLVVQDEAIERIIGTLGGQRGKMYESEYKKVWVKATPELQEYDYFLRSNFFFQQFTPESLAKATDIIHEGLEKFPDSSLLLCGLAWDHVLAVSLGFDDKEPEEHWRIASEIQTKVLPRANLGPDAKKSCLWSSVYVSAHEGKFDKSLRRAEEVIALSPNDPLLVGDLSQAARFNGQTDKALEWADFGLKNDPTFADYYFLMKANALTDIEKYAESTALISKASDFQITFPLLRAINDVRLGKYAEARREIAKALAMQPWYTAKRWRDWTFHINPGVIDRQVADLVAAGLPAN